jgi:hypothetical protein
LFKEEPYFEPKTNCNPEYPHFSAGDLNLTASNFDKFKKNNNVFVMGLSDKSCI